MSDSTVYIAYPILKKHIFGPISCVPYENVSNSKQQNSPVTFQFRLNSNPSLGTKLSHRFHFMLDNQPIA